MGWKTLWANQFKKPRGLLGHWAARFMEKRNRVIYPFVLRTLDIQDQDHILEIGFGTGLAIHQILEQNRHGLIRGIDFSRLMLKKAMRRNRSGIQSHRVRLECGDILTHDFNGETFDKIFAVNVIYFWDSLPPVFRRLRLLTAAGGRVVLYLAGAECLRQLPMAVDGVFNKYTADEVVGQLTQAGFPRVHTEVVTRDRIDTYCLRADG